MKGVIVEEGAVTAGVYECWISRPGEGDEADCFRRCGECKFPELGVQGRGPGGVVRDAVNVDRFVVCCRGKEVVVVEDGLDSIFLVRFELGDDVASVCVREGDRSAHGGGDEPFLAEHDAGEDGRGV